MKTRRMCTLLAAAVTSLALLVASGTPASAVTTYGTLDNFDVINDTGGPCHGFEIEMEGITKQDVVYTFGTPYIRYGDPTVVETITGAVIVRYAATYDVGAGTWSATTPVAVAPYLPTQGHSCWTGGVADPAQYYSAGCDHFGVSLNGTPTKTTYRWLVEGAPGMLVAFGSNVPLPAPAWNVTPPAPGGQPIAAAAITPPPPTDHEFGDALWVKVFVTELPSELQADDLDHMVIDDPNADLVPHEPAEVEIEWVLLQSSTENEGEQEFGGGAEVGAGNESVSRRFEFYKYTGQYDPETHEALCDDPTDEAQQVPERCGEPDPNGVAGVGDLIGAQNVAINLAGPLNPPPANEPPVAQCTAVEVATNAGVCSAPASVDAGSFDPDGNPITLSQLPAGPYGLGSTPVTLTVTDDKGASSTCSATVTVVDNQTPVITCPAPQVVDCTGPSGATVSFSASATDNCSVASTSCPDSGTSIPLGTTPVTCTATDGTGLTSTCGSSVTVQDRTPPSIGAVSASPNILKPANHKMVAVTVTTSVSDACDPGPVCHIVGVTSNEPISGLKKHDRTPDWEITGSLTVNLRAERDNKGDNGKATGRVYTLAVECADTGGNTSTGTTTVSVPR